MIKYNKTLSNYVKIFDSVLFIRISLINVSFIVIDFVDLVAVVAFEFVVVFVFVVLQFDIVVLHS